MTDAPPTDPVPTPVKPGYKTTEFYFSLLATLLTFLFASGALTSNTALAIAGMAATVLTAAGYKVSRTLVKNAAFLALVVLGLGASQLACATVKTEATAAKTAIVDCVHADQAPIEALLVQLGADAVTFALHGSVDWGALEQAAERQGAVIGGCAFALFAGHPWPAPASSSTGVAVSALMTPPPEPDPRAAALERLRAGFGGVRWQTSAGVL